YIKRFSVTSITRDKEYDLTNGSDQSQILYFSANPNGEAETVTILLRALQRIKKIKWDIDFADILIKGRSSRGNLVTKFPIKKIELKEKGISTLKPRKIWFDNTVQRLNVDERGDLLGEFTAEDRLLIINQSGLAKTISPELTTHFDDDMIVLEKWNPNKPISVIYFEGEKERYYVKRFMIEHPNKEEIFISDHPKTQLQIVATDFRPVAEVIFSKKSLDKITVNFEDFISIKGIKSLGNQLTTDKIKDIILLDPLPYEEPELNEVEVVDEEILDNQPEVKSDQQKPLDDGSDPDLEEDGQTKLF
ncbi:MAG: DNA gyrase/topoisomerase IV subunit A, partial [Lutimonas sp.]